MALPEELERAPWMTQVVYAVHTMMCTYLLDEEGVCRWALGPDGATAHGIDRCVGAQFVACLDADAPGQLIGELKLGASALLARVEGGRIVLMRSPSIEWVEEREKPSNAGVAARRSNAEATLPLASPPPRRSTPPSLAPPPHSPPVAPPHSPPPRAPVPRASAPPARQSVPPERPLPAPSAPPLPRVEPPRGPLPMPTAPPKPRAPTYSELADASARSPSLAEFSPETAAIASAFEHAGDEVELDVEDLVTYTEVTLTIPLYRPEIQPEPPPPARRAALMSRGQRLR